MSAPLPLPAAASPAPVRANTVATLRSLRDDNDEPTAIEDDFSFDLSGPAEIRVPRRQRISDDPVLLERRISHLFTKASKDFLLLEPGDKVMVCMSGGKDSYGLLHFMQRAQKHSPIKFDLIAVHLDQGHPGFPLATLEGYLQSCGSPYEIVHNHTYDIVLQKLEPGKTTCSLCSRLRRGVLYDTAKRLGCNKIALGHHRDDMVATLLLNLFFCGQLKAMPPRLAADDGINTVIRPLCYVPEPMLIKWAQLKNYPLIPCNLCSRQPDLKRAQMNSLLAELDQRYPSALPSALHAVQNIKPRFLLDRNLYDFQAKAGAGDRDEDAFA